jgi:hypothetical protein
MFISAISLRSLVTLVLATQAPAGEVPAPAPPSAPTAPAKSEDSDFGSDSAGEGKAKKKKKKDKADKGDAPGDESIASAIANAIEVKGRVFALAKYTDERLDNGATDIEQQTLVLSVPSARAGFKATVRKGISLTIEADFAGSRASIRDGYIQAKSKSFVLRAGRFKMPISAFTLESPWRLPRAERGELDDVLSERLLLSGRREGLMGRWEGGGFWDVAVTAGVFQAEDVSAPKALTEVVRVSIEPSDTEIALVGLRRSALVAGEARSFHSGGFDLTSRAEVAGLGLRTWAEGQAGQSWYHQPAPNEDALALTRGPAATFLQLRGMAALRVGGVEHDERYAELFFSGGYLDPDLGVIQDYFLEVSAGVNLGHWETTRLTFEVVHARSGINFPDAIFREAVLPTVEQRTAALLQLGAAF